MDWETGGLGLGWSGGLRRDSGLVDKAGVVWWTRVLPSPSPPVSLVGRLVDLDKAETVASGDGSVPSSYLYWTSPQQITR